MLLYRADAEHDHGNLNNTSEFGLSEAVKLEVNKLFDLSMKPKYVMKRLTNIHGITVRKMSQLRNHLSVQRRVKYWNHSISLGELQGWLSSHSVLPDDPHEALIISYDVIENDIHPACRLAISTKYLLELARDTEILHTDATYKLIWQGFPVLVIGKADKVRKFHALCLGIEKKNDI